MNPCPNGEVKSVFIPHPVFDGRSMPVFTSWISWGLRCQALGKPKMPHHNVTPQPQWQTTNPRDTQLNDLSHLVRGEHCLPNNQGMAWVWGAGHLIRSISFEMPRLTANGLYTANGAKYYEERGKFDDLRAVPSSVKPLARQCMRWGQP